MAWSDSAASALVRIGPGRAADAAHPSHPPPLRQATSRQERYPTPDFSDIVACKPALRLSIVTIAMGLRFEPTGTIGLIVFFLTMREEILVVWFMRPSGFVLRVSGRPPGAFLGSFCEFCPYRGGILGSFCRFGPRRGGILGCSESWGFGGAPAPPKYKGTREKRPRPFTGPEIRSTPFSSVWVSHGVMRLVLRIRVAFFTPTIVESPGEITGHLNAKRLEVVAEVSNAGLLRLYVLVGY